MTSENLDTIQAEYQAGQIAFERGEYRKSIQHLETANTLASPSSQLGGEVQIWLVTAYEAAGQQAEAIALCRQVSRHPDYKTRKEGKRILYILEAPKLKSRPEWLTQIPDLTNLSEGKAEDRKGGSQYVPPTASKKQSSPTPSILVEPVDPNQVNTRDNQFVWIALVATVLAIGSLLWFS